MFGSKKEDSFGANQQVKGRAVVETTVTNRDTGAERVRREERSFGYRSFDGPHATVSAGHGTNMSIAYQSVSTQASIQMPCQPTEAAAREMMDFCWSFVESELAERAAWSKEILGVMAEAKEKYESKKR